jgi:hypothetical protein
MAPPKTTEIASKQYESVEIEIPLIGIDFNDLHDDDVSTPEVSTYSKSSMDYQSRNEVLRRRYVVYVQAYFYAFVNRCVCMYTFIYTCI